MKAVLVQLTHVFGFFFLILCSPADCFDFFILSFFLFCASARILKGKRQTAGRDRRHVSVKSWGSFDFVIFKWSSRLYADDRSGRMLFFARLCSLCSSSGPVRLNGTSRIVIGNNTWCIGLLDLRRRLSNFHTNTTKTPSCWVLGPFTCTFCGCCLWVLVVGVVVPTSA